MGNRADAVVDAAYQAHQGDGYSRDKVAAESSESPADVTAEVAKAFQILILDSFISLPIFKSSMCRAAPRSGRRCAKPLQCEELQETAHGEL